MAQARYERLSNDNSHSNEEIELSLNNYDDEDDDDDVYELALDKSKRANKANYDFGNSSHSRADSSHITMSQQHNNANSTATAAQAYIPRNQLMQLALSTFICILIYLALSISMVFYQRKMIKQYGFPFTIVCYHLVIKFCLAYFVRFLYKLHTGKARVLLDFRTTLKKMAPTGFASGIDIGFSSLGFKTVSIALYTMTKSSSIIFILFFAILLGLERRSTLLIFTVSLIAIGLFMFTYKSTEFAALGFVYILVASFSSGIRWSLAQFLMQRTKLGLHNPIDMIFHMQPWMLGSLLPFVAIFEAKELYKVLAIDMPNTDAGIVYLVALKITAGAVLAFQMEVSEFLVLSRTSGLTLSIAGIFKDVCQVVLAVELNDEKVSPLKVVGMLVCLAGITCHVFHKYTAFRRMAARQALEDDDNGADGDGVGVGGLAGAVGGGGAGSAAAYYNEPHNVSISNGGVPTTLLGGGGGGGGGGKRQQQSAASVPLLEQTDSNDDADSDGDSDNPNASDVIFDVLNRRDMPR